MEGATGVTCPADVEPGTEQWHRFRRVLTDDVNAAVDGLLDGGAAEVLVNEAHATMRNVLLEHLDPRALLLTGRHKGLSMLEGIDRDVDGVALVGYHTGAGTDGVLSHTYLPNSITGVWVDGVPASEGRLAALLADERGVPVLLVTGDDLTCRDAGTYAPDARRVAVKDCVTRYAAVCRPPAVTGPAIRTAARESMARAGRRPAAAPRPRHVEVEFDAAHLAVAVAVIPGVEATDVRRVAYDSPTMREAVRCFKAVTVLADAAIEEFYG